MLAGVSIEKITSLIGFSMPVIRIMPNTPVLVGSGMIAYSKNELISEKCEAEFRYMLKNAGTLDALVENLIDAETAVAGCGPAFVYMFIDALGKAGAECGLSPEKALLYAAETAKGAAEMILAGIDTPSELTRKVCSPGGSTIEGVKSLLESNLDAVVSKAVGASFKRTKELGK
jgi:pyrroline-5-carboxylate reductase